MKFCAGVLIFTERYRVIVRFVKFTTGTPIIYLKGSMNLHPYFPYFLTDVNEIR